MRLPQVRMPPQTAGGEEPRVVPPQVVAQDGEGLQQHLREADGGQHQTHLVRGGVRLAVVAAAALLVQGGVAPVRRVPLAAGEAVQAAAPPVVGVLPARAEVAGVTAVLGKAAGTCKYSHLEYCSRYSAIHVF